MQQRQYRPGDSLDDYCPRERRITNHAVVAMVEDQIHTTRCAVCESEHDFKNAKVPAQRRKSSTAALFTQVLDNLESPHGRLASPASERNAASPEFTMHQPLNNRGKRPAQGRFRRRPAGSFDQAGPMRSGRDQGNAHGNGSGAGAGQGGRRRRRKKH